MQKTYLIGTRDSALAVWQANFIKSQLAAMDINSELIYIKSEGETDTITPLYELGVSGIFTRTLDMALLNNQIDIAVHSLKDVPTILAEGLCLAAVPARASHLDVLVSRTPISFTTRSNSYKIATSSLRRQAQWKNRFPNSEVVSLRGNINTRLKKVEDTMDWDGAIFAEAGIDRIQLQVPAKTPLTWMLPAPAQGALGVVCRESDTFLLELITQLNHTETLLAVHAERDYLRTLMGGCTMPIAAYAHHHQNQLYFKGNVLTVDGGLKAEVQFAFNSSEWNQAGKIAAQEILSKGGEAIIETFRKK